MSYLINKVSKNIPIVVYAIVQCLVLESRGLNVLIQKKSASLDVCSRLNAGSC